MTKDDTFEVSDSTDWLETPLRSLAAVDSALRCQVCKDFYTTPMITSCSHTFCSLCIRRCLNNDGRCPACRAQDQELKLRFNGAMEDLVQAFTKARPDVLEHARKPAEVVRILSPKRSREEAGLEDGDEEPRKRTRSSGRRKQKVEIVVEDSMDDDEDYVPEDGFVMCPICQKQVKEAGINAHIDRGCMDEPRVTKVLGGKFSKGSAPVVMPEKPIKRPERLPQLNYSMVKDNALRKKLTDMGLSAGGSRQLMEKRYTEWITLCNANCDATHPKTKGELKRELDVWERTQGGKAPSSNFAKDPGSQIKEKDFDGQAWSSKHDDSFKALIANARRKSKPPTTEPTPDPPNVPDSSAIIAAPTALLNLSTADISMADRTTDHELQELLPTKQTGSQSKFFQESDIGDDISPSSRYGSKILSQEGIAPDIATS